MEKIEEKNLHPTRGAATVLISGRMMTMTKECNKEALKEILNYAKSIVSSNVFVTHGADCIMFSIHDDLKKDRAEMLDVRCAVGKFILENYHGRKWFVKKSRGYRVWRWTGEFNYNFGGLRCGLRFECTEEERHDIRLGINLFK